MKVSEHRKMVLELASSTDAKRGLRTMAGNRKSLQVGHAIIGVNTEVGELMEATTAYLAGQPIFQSDGTLTPELGESIREELGDILWYTVLGAKFLGVKMPSSSSKKFKKQTSTPTELLLKANAIATHLLSAFKKTYYGRGLGEGSIEVTRTKAEVKMLTDRRKAQLTAAGATPEAIAGASVSATKKGNSPAKDEFLSQLAVLWEEFIPVIYQLNWAFLKAPVSETLAANHQKLASGPNPRYKGGKFSPEAAMKRADKA